MSANYGGNIFFDRDIDKADKVNCAQVVKAFMIERTGYGKPLSGVTKEHLRTTTEGQALELLSALNEPGMNIYKSLKGVQSQHDVWQHFVCEKSHLRGFVYFFVCSRCGRPVRDLYRPIGSNTWRCRACHCLTYNKRPKKTTKDKKYRPYEPRIKTYPKPNFWDTGR